MWVPRRSEPDSCFHAHQMRFVIRDGRPRRHSPIDYPTAVLSRDDWDDYGYRTLFTVDLYVDPDTRLELGQVKILKRAQSSGRTPMPQHSFDSLTDDYCSLGQAYSYY